MAFRTTLAALAGVAVGVVGACEFAHWRASLRSLGTRGLGSAGRAARSEAVIVLGYRSTKAGDLHPLQAWRTRIAVRSMDPDLDSRLVFSGGVTRGGRSEASVMAAYATGRLGVSADRILLEEEARSTGENVAFCIPLVESADLIKIASNSLHALRARRYLREQRPDLADRLVRAADYRVGEFWWLKLVLVGYTVWANRRRRKVARLG